MRQSFADRICRLCQSFWGNPMRVILLILTDLLWNVSVLSVMMWLYHFLKADYVVPTEFSQDAWELSGIIVVISAFAKCYHGNILNPGAAINRVEEIRRLSLSVVGGYCLGGISLHLNGRGDAYPLIPMFISLVCAFVGFPFVRFLVRYCMKKAKVGQIRVFVAGAGKTAQTVGEELEVSTYYGYEVVGYFDDDVSKRDVVIHGKKWLGCVSDAPLMAQRYNVHSIICCLPASVLPRMTQLFTHTFEHVLFIPSAGVLPITAVYPTLIGFVSGFEFQNRIMFIFPRIIKRVAEVLISILCVVLLMPLFVVLAILVKHSSPGPVIYTAKRLGVGGREIKVFKFRTMYQDADTRLEALFEENPTLKSEWKKKFKLFNDPRVTRIGRFLRKTSLDELPQFINVIRGEMSIIGPRPIVQEEVKYYGEAYEYLKQVRPGITGLWQVSGRSSTTYSQRVAMDMFYVMNWSVWLDWYILWKTVMVIFMCKGSC